MIKLADVFLSYFCFHTFFVIFFCIFQLGVEFLYPTDANPERAHKFKHRNHQYTQTFHKRTFFYSSNFEPTTVVLRRCVRDSARIKKLNLQV